MASALKHRANSRSSVAHGKERRGGDYRPTTQLTRRSRDLTELDTRDCKALALEHFNHLCEKPVKTPSRLKTTSADVDYDHTFSPARTLCYDLHKRGVRKEYPGVTQEEEENDRECEHEEKSITQ
ncbi:hypothetical protein V7S43_010619 [Phytophthora oleae]|uniref:Uncharacterized protein n=1 Tax=Phytophthora oleae TaxID=2107226 RepID=A0ABD3FBM6_9STRA